MIIKSSPSVPSAPVTMLGACKVSMQMLLGPQDQCPNFAMRKFSVAPGGNTPRHQHDYEHEILVLGGRGTAFSAQGVREIVPGDVIFVPPNEMHQFVNTGTENLVFICLVPASVHRSVDCSK